MPLLIHSKLLVPITQPPIPNASILIHNHKIVTFNSTSHLKKLFPTTPSLDLYPSIVLPGFINAHAHLELSFLQKPFPKPQSFTHWLSQIVQTQAHTPPPNILAQSIQKQIHTLLQSGVVAVGDISTQLASYTPLSQNTLTTRLYLEFLALKPHSLPSQSQKLFQNLKSILSILNPPPHISLGISPHSPYSLSLNAFQFIHSFISNTQFPSAIHVAESLDELALFREKSGPLFQFITSIAPSPLQKPFPSPLQFLNHHQLLPKNPLLVHLNTLHPNDIPILQKSNASVCHCPLSHSYFNHPKFQLHSLLNHHINIAIGTDSLASSKSLNFFHQLLALSNAFPSLHPHQILQMATISGQIALQLPHGLGQISPNSPFDLIAILPNQHFKNPLESVLTSQSIFLRISSFFPKNPTHTLLPPPNPDYLINYEPIPSPVHPCDSLSHIPTLASNLPKPSN